MNGLRRRAGWAALAGFAMLAAVAAAADQTPHVELERLKRAPGADAAAKAPAAPEVVNAFSSTSWYVPPPPAKALPPPKPTAPPLPFTFMGRYDDARKAVVMLVKGDRLYTVSVGDVIDGTYRVDRISDKSVDLIYLPLHEMQSLPAGGA